MIALSTTWGRGRFDSLPALFEALRERFPAFEIALPSWDPEAPPDARRLRALGIRCTSLAYRPDPGAARLCDDGKGRLEALADLRGACSAARRAGIARVTFPGGAVRGSDREEHAGRALENLARSLFELARGEDNLSLCVETPEDPAGLPAPGELDGLLAEAAAPRVGYCHVAGRAARLEAVAGWDSALWLDRARERTNVVVLDDGTADADGLLPGCGRVAFADLRELIPPGAARVLRPPGDAEPELLDGAVAFLLSRGLS